MFKRKPQKIYLLKVKIMHDLSYEAYKELHDHLWLRLRYFWFDDCKESKLQTYVILALTNVRPNENCPKET